MRLEATVIFNLTTGKRHRIRRYMQGESEDEFWGRAICTACKDEGDHYVYYEIGPTGGGLSGVECVYVKYGPDIYLKPRKLCDSEYPFTKIKKYER